MTLVILDDDDRRLIEMARAAQSKGIEVRSFKTAPEVVAYLSDHMGQTSLISLDHDLMPINPELVGCGRDVSDWLATQHAACPVIIHSTNAHASDAMSFDLREAGWRIKIVRPYDDLTWVEEAWLPLVLELTS